MRTLVLATAAFLSLAAPVLAADLRLPVKTPPPVVPAFNFTGCYAGGQAGGLWNRQQWVNQTPGILFGQPLGGHDVGNWLAGAQAGCDYQFASGLVIGAAGDYALSDAVGSHSSAREFGVDYHSDAKSIASATGRIGYAFDHLLGYVKAGGAWQHDYYSASNIIIGMAYAARDTRAGWTVGVGAEYAFTNMLSGFIEWDYYDFGTSRIALTPQIAGLPPAFADIRESSSALRVGFNLRFGGLALPAARF
jgi:outer membrane immunogenic protein